MAIEVWVRNPHNYVRECVEVGITSVAWDVGILLKKHIDPYKFMNLYYGTRHEWRALIIGGKEAIEINRDHDRGNPVAKYPIWKYGDDLDLLIRYIHLMEQLDLDKVVITELPPGYTGVGSAFIRELSDIQEEYPNVKLHIHGLYSFRNMYGLRFRSVDVDGRTYAANGQVELPSGKRIRFEGATLEVQWIKLLGMNPVDLKIPRNRCIFNLRSHLWGAENFQRAINFRTKRGTLSSVPDFNSPVTIIPEKKSNSPFSVRPRIELESDRFLCNLCSLQSSCTYYREGSVCIVPGSDAADLAKFFKTRDSDTIIEGLGTLLAAQSRRVAKALDAEEAEDKLHPETRKLINDLFDRGVRLAKLVDPRLAAAGAARINLTNNTQNVVQGTPQGFMAAIVDEFVKRGIPRSDITTDMILRVLNQPESVQQKAIEVAITEKIALEAGN